MFIKNIINKNVNYVLEHFVSNAGLYANVKKNVSLFIAVIFLLIGCDGPTGRKSQYNAPRSNEITVGVVYPVSINDLDTYFYKGIEFAMNTINNNGGVLGKRLAIVVRDDGNNANTAMQIAQTFFNNGITAVIGHWTTSVCYYAQDVYEKNKIVMLTPQATGLIIFEERFDYIFRMIGSNQVFATAITSHVAEKGLKRIAIYYSEDEYGTDFAKILEKELNAYGIVAVDRVTSITPLNVRAVLERWSAYGIHGVIMAASYPQYVNTIKTIRDAGCWLPILGGDSFDLINIDEMLDGYTDNIYITVLKQEYLDADFLEKFRIAYGHDPDSPAIAGYEALTLLKDAIEGTGSVDGTAIANFLSGLKEYKTVSGSRTYNPETQEFDGYNIHIRSLNSILLDRKNSVPKPSKESEGA